MRSHPFFGAGYGDETDDFVDEDTGQLSQAFMFSRMQAAQMPTRHLRRVERGYRRDHCNGVEHDHPALAGWAAARAELRHRGYRLPDTGTPPRPWWQRRTVRAAWLPVAVVVVVIGQWIIRYGCPWL